MKVYLLKNKNCVFKHLGCSRVCLLVLYCFVVCVWLCSSIEWWYRCSMFGVTCNRCVCVCSCFVFNHRVLCVCGL